MTVKKEKLTTDDVFLQIGEIGKYQLLIFCLVGSVAFIAAISAFQPGLTDATPQHRCKIPSIDNDTYEVFSEEHQKLIDLYIPKDEENGGYDGCKIRTNASLNSSEIECTSWVYSKEYYDYTIITQYDFVCSNLAEKGIYKSLFFAGTFGVFFIGILGDRFGRKSVTYVFIGLSTLIFIINAFSVNLIKDRSVSKIMLGFTRFTLGLTSNIFAIAVVLVVEIVGPSYRVAATNSINYFFCLGQFLVVLIFYFQRDYRIYSIISTIFISLIMTYFWIVPESARFLIKQKRFDEADVIFRRIAKSNKKEYTLLSKNLSNDNENNNKEKVGFKTLMTNRKFIVGLLVYIVQWFTNSFVYYGISLNTDVLGGNPYMNFFYSTLMELLATLGCHLVLDKFGRKIPYLINAGLIVASMIGIGFVPSNIVWLKIILVLIAKFAASFNFQCIYIVTTESYPTVIRNTALSTCSTSARLGSTISPYAVILGDLLWKPLPFILYASFAAFAGTLYLLFVPETKGIKLADTLEDYLKGDKVQAEIEFDVIKF